MSGSRPAPRCRFPRAARAASACSAVSPAATLPPGNSQPPARCAAGRALGDQHAALRRSRMTPAATCRSPDGVRRRRQRGSVEATVALLVLLAGPAGTGLVAADLAIAPHEGRAGRAARPVAGRPAPRAPARAAPAPSRRRRPRRPAPPARGIGDGASACVNCMRRSSGRLALGDRLYILLAAQARPGEDGDHLALHLVEHAGRTSRRPRACTPAWDCAGRSRAGGCPGAGSPSPPGAPSSCDRAAGASPPSRSGA